MAGASVTAIAEHLDRLLGTASVPDYPGAVNGLQVANRSPIRKVATAVDASLRTIEGAIAADANLLIVHHGLFWGGTQPLVGARYDRLRLLIEHDIGVVMGLSHHVVVLDYGRKVGDGTPEEVRNNPDVITAYLGAVH